jgi:hypothetical protein
MAEGLRSSRMNDSALEEGLRKGCERYEGRNEHVDMEDRRE